MFKDLIIGLSKDTNMEHTPNAEWDDNGTIFINPYYIVRYKWNEKKINSIEEMVYIINVEFLTEFICMDMAKGITDDVWEGYCDREPGYYCSMKEIVLEMMVVND